MYSTGFDNSFNGNKDSSLKQKKLQESPKKQAYKQIGNSRHYSMPTGENRGSFSRGRSGEITDKGHKGSIEVQVMQGNSMPQDGTSTDQVIVNAPVYVMVDSRQRKRTMIKNAYKATKKTAPSRSPTNDSQDLPKPNQTDQRIPQSVLDQQSSN